MTEQVDPRTSYKLFIGGLTIETNEKDIESHFSKFGFIYDILIIRNRWSNQSKGYGFISCNCNSTYQRLINNEHIVNGRLIDCHDSFKKSDDPDKFQDNANKKIFVGGITLETTDLDLYNYFSQFGKIRQAYVIKNPITKRSKKFGFTIMRDQESVDAVLSASDHRIKGVQVSCKLFVKVEKEEQEDNFPVFQVSHLYPNGAYPTQTRAHVGEKNPENEAYWRQNEFGGLYSQNDDMCKRHSLSSFNEAARMTQESSYNSRCTTNQAVQLSQSQFHPKLVDSEFNTAIREEEWNLPHLSNVQQEIRQACKSLINAHHTRTSNEKARGKMGYFTIEQHKQERQFTQTPIAQCADQKFDRIRSRNGLEGPSAGVELLELGSTVVLLKDNKSLGMRDMKKIQHFVNETFAPHEDHLRYNVGWLLRPSLSKKSE